MKLEEIKALIEAATPGPWFLTEVGAIRSKAPPTFGIDAIDKHFKDHTQWCAFVDEKTANGEFIAASRTLMPKLLRIAEHVAKRPRSITVKSGPLAGMELTIDWQSMDDALAALESDS